MELRELDIIQRFLADLLYGYADLDPKNTGLDREEAAKRRRAFHELVTLDVWQVSLAAWFSENVSLTLH